MPDNAFSNAWCFESFASFCMSQKKDRQRGSVFIGQSIVWLCVQMYRVHMYIHKCLEMQYCTTVGLLANFRFKIPWQKFLSDTPPEIWEYFSIFVCTMLESRKKVRTNLKFASTVVGLATALRGVCVCTLYICIHNHTIDCRTKTDPHWRSFFPVYADQSKRFKAPSVGESITWHLERKTASNSDRCNEKIAKKFD